LQPRIRLRSVAAPMPVTTKRKDYGFVHSEHFTDSQNVAQQKGNRSIFMEALCAKV
jgi:hypothetical protein